MLPQKYIRSRTDSSITGSSNEGTFSIVFYGGLAKDDIVIDQQLVDLFEKSDGVGHILGSVSEEIEGSGEDLYPVKDLHDLGDALFDIDVECNEIVIEGVFDLEVYSDLLEVGIDTTALGCFSFSISRDSQRSTERLESVKIIHHDSITITAPISREM